MWASTKAVTPEDEVPLNTSRAHDGPLDEDEKERIRSALLDDSESGENEDNVDGSQEEEEGEGEEESDGDSDAEDVPLRASEFWDRNLSRISKERGKVPKQSLKERQLALIGAEVRNVMEEAERDLHDRESRFLEETRRRWVSLGMIREEDAHLLDKVGGPYYPNIERTREEYFLRKREEEMQELEEKARKFYEDEWVLQKEQELTDLQKQEDSATDQDVKKALQYMIGVAEEALKLNFKKVEVPGLAKLVLEERRRKCVEMGLTSTQQTQWICTIWQSLPYPCEALPRRDEETDEEDMFITQAPSHTQDSGYRETVEELNPLSPSGAATPRRSPPFDPDFVPPTPSWVVRPIEDYSLPSTWGGIPVNSPKRPTKRKSPGMQRAGKRGKCLSGQKTILASSCLHTTSLCMSQ